MKNIPNSSSQNLVKRNDQQLYQTRIRGSCSFTNNFTWGVPVKSDPKHVVYVWIDALSNYITALGYGSEDESLFENTGLQMFRWSVKKSFAFIRSIGQSCWPLICLYLKVFGHGWLLMKDGKCLNQRKCRLS